MVSWLCCFWVSVKAKRYDKNGVVEQNYPPHSSQEAEKGAQDQGDDTSGHDLLSQTTPYLPVMTSHNELTSGFFYG